jgi:hypothetical protein
MTDYDDLPFKVERWSEDYGRPEETNRHDRRFAVSQSGIRGGSEAATRRADHAQAEVARDTEVARKLKRRSHADDGQHLPGAEERSRYEG